MIPGARKLWTNTPILETDFISMDLFWNMRTEIDVQCFNYKKIIKIIKSCLKRIRRILLYRKKWPVGTPATAISRGWCPHQPQYGGE